MLHFLKDWWKFIQIQQYYTNYYGFRRTYTCARRFVVRYMFYVVQSLYNVVKNNITKTNMIIWLIYEWLTLHNDGINLVMIIIVPSSSVAYL